MRRQARRGANVTTRTDDHQTGEHELQRAPDQRSGDGARGREARTPTDVPARGWKDVLTRVKDEVTDDNVPLLSAGVAFYALLALFPALIALVTVWGLVASPQQIASTLSNLTAQLPSNAAQLLQQQLQQATSSTSTALGWGLAASLVGVLWSASSGVGGLIKGVNAAYDETDDRGFVKRRGLALLLTLGGIVFFVVALTLTTAVVPVAQQFGLPGWLLVIVGVARWLVLAAFVMGALAVIYRVAPDRDEPRWRWVSPGAVAATVLWIAASIGFSFYVRNFSTYAETYGAIAGVIVLLLWLFLGALAVLIGAEINAEAERQTRRDTTRGRARERGERDARAADTVGRSAD